MKTIDLMYKGDTYTLKVDDEDFEMVSNLNLSIENGSKVVHNYKNDEGKYRRTSVRKLIMNTSDEVKLYCIDDDFTNLQKINIKEITHCEVKLPIVNKNRICRYCGKDITSNVKNKYGLVCTSCFRIMTIYENMKNRCYNKNHISFKNYGARNITICNEWKNCINSFVVWSLQNGYTVELTIDRIDNNGNYEPSNCRWITMQEQCQNKRNNVLTKEKVLLIRRLYNNGIAICKIRNLTKISKQNIIDVVSFKSWYNIK